MILVSISLALIALLGGMFLLAKTQKDNLNLFFKVVAYFIIVVSFLSIGCIVLRGAVGEQLFHETQTESYFLWAKFGEHIAQARKDQIDPEFLSHLDKLMAKPAAKKRVKALRDRIAARAAHAAAAKAGK